jgi:hypothetical protein
LTLSVTPNQSDIQSALRTCLLAILPAATAVVAGQVNRVPEPAGADFIVMWPINRNRIETNIDASLDALFNASISGSVMNVASLAYGAISIGSTVFGVNVADGTTVASNGTGSGGVGSYNLSNSQNVASENMACGITDLTQPVELVMQLDVHGPASADNAQMITTVLRDAYGVALLQAANPEVTPLFADDPRQVPFINAEQQFENRWIVDVHLQVNQKVIIPQQFADVIDVGVISVEATYQ